MIRVILLLTLAVGVGFGTIKLAQNWLANERAANVQQVAAVQPEVAKTYVLVAEADLAAGSFVKPEDMRWQAWPDDSLPPSFVVQGQRGLDEFVGGVVRSRISAGEAITDTRIVKPGERGFLAAVLTPGMRAVAVPIDERSGIAGLIFPGDHVDMIVTHTLTEQPPPPPEGGQAPPAVTRRVSETVLQDIRILAIDQAIDSQVEAPLVGARTATLEVTPRQAEVISVMLQLGTVSLSLRSLGDPLVAAAAPAPTPVVAHAEASVPATDPAAGKTALIAKAGALPTATTAVAETTSPASAQAAPMVPSYTLDSDVSQLLEPPGMAQHGDEAEVSIVRGGALASFN